MARPRDIGTRVETAIVKACQAAGFPYADRQPLRGNRDQGDIVVTPGVIIEAKGGKAAEQASDNQIRKWMDELLKAQEEAHAVVAALVTKRAGIGHGNAHNWRAHILLPTLTGNPYYPPIITTMTLGDFLALLKKEGW